MNSAGKSSRTRLFQLFMQLIRSLCMMWLLFIQKEETNFRETRVGKRTLAELKSMLEVLGLERSGRQVSVALRFEMLGQGL